jgi:hypothetical protein
MPYILQQEIISVVGGGGGGGGRDVVVVDSSWLNFIFYLIFFLLVGCHALRVHRIIADEKIMTENRSLVFRPSSAVFFSIAR